MLRYRAGINTKFALIFMRQTVVYAIHQPDFIARHSVMLGLNKFHSRNLTFKSR